jgi:hypothetical protein
MKRYILAAVVVAMLGVAGGSQAADPPINPAPLKVGSKAQLASLPAAQGVLLPDGSRTTAGALRTQFEESARGLGAKARAAAAAHAQQMAAAGTAAGTNASALAAGGVVLLGSEAFYEEHPPQPPSAIPHTPTPQTDWCAAWNVKATICWSETVGVFDASSVPGVPTSMPWGQDGPLVQHGTSYEASLLAQPCTVPPPPPPPDPKHPKPPGMGIGGGGCTAPMLHPGYVVDHIVTKVVEGSPGVPTAGPAVGGGIHVKFGAATPKPRTDAVLVWVYVKPAPTLVKPPIQSPPTVQK